MSKKDVPEESPAQPEQPAQPQDAETPVEPATADAAEAEMDAAQAALDAEPSAVADEATEAAAEPSDADEQPADESAAPSTGSGQGDEEAAESESAALERGAAVEAILFASDKPLPAAKINEIGRLGGVRNVRLAIAALNERYAQAGASFRVTEIAGGFQMRTLPEYADVVARLVKIRSDSRLSQAAMETLAIIAYRQPVLRADIEAIRGVACGEVLRGLMERNLIHIAGRAEEIGRPLLYGTTRHFLEVFGLPSLEDLPNSEQLRQPPAKPPAPAQPAPAADGQPATAAAQPTSAGDAAQPAADQPQAPAEQPELAQDGSDAPAPEPSEPAAQGDSAEPPAEDSAAAEE